MYKWCKKLGFCYKQHNKKIEAYQQFDVNIILLGARGVGISKYPLMSVMNEKRDINVYY